MHGVWQELPPDAVDEVLLRVEPATARLVSKGSRDLVDTSRKRFDAYGLGLDGLPRFVADRFPNLQDLTVTVGFSNLRQAYPEALPAMIPYETFVGNVHRGLLEWADTVSRLPHLRHLHLNMEPALLVLEEHDEEAFARSVVRSPLTHVTVGSWGTLRRFPGLMRMEVPMFWRLHAAANKGRQEGRCGRPLCGHYTPM